MGQGMEHLARNSLLSAVFDHAESYGISRDDILAEIGVDAATAMLPGGYVRSSSLIDAVEYAALASRRDDFGLTLFARRDHTMMGPIGVLQEHCASVAEAVTESLKYLHIHNTALQYTPMRQGNRYIVTLSVLAQGKYSPRHYVETLIAGCVRLARIWLGDRWMPVGVSFEHARMARIGAYSKVLGPNVTFEAPANAITLRLSDAERTSTRPNPRVKQMAQQFLVALDREHATVLTPKVAALVRILIPSGQATAARVAASLSTSPRSLQRRLAEEGTSFTRELNEARLQLAHTYLERNVSLTGLAPILGLSEATAVSRFLKREAGSSVRRMRRDG
jgi:AraC-like DNA-binding protein